jgi:hypothetical protein
MNEFLQGGVSAGARAVGPEKPDFANLIVEIKPFRRFFNR